MHWVQRVGGGAGEIMDPLTLELRSADAPTIKGTLADSSTYVLGFDGVFESNDDVPPANQIRLVTQHQQLFVVPGGNTALLVNGKSATGPTPVQHGDWVTVSDIVYQVKLTTSSGPRAASRAPAPEPPPAISDEQRPASAPAGNVRVLIGRHQGCALTIDSPLISREHASLTANGGEWLIEDLRSVNGTFVNGRRIRAPIALNTGDRVGIATFLYRFTGDGLIADGE
ncbi:MAG: FHA domain-containing protein, partial [Gammaproteobacteria bacterium]